jgi:nitrous oxidase accessory protein
MNLPLIVFLFLLLSGKGIRASEMQSPSSLQQRINTAKNGDTVFVEHGIYEGNVVIDRSVTFIGKSKPIIRGYGRGSVVTIAADSCTIRGFAVEHSGGMLMDEDAGILVKSNSNTIEDNDLRDVLFGIYLFHAEHNTVAGNTIRGRKELDLGQRGSGIHIWNSNDNRFTDNTIVDTRDGFYIQYANRTHIENNKVFDLRYGVHYMYADSNVFLNNTFSNNIAGAAIMYSRDILIRRNIFIHNREFSSFGILFQDCHNAVIDSNIIADNVIGVFFEASTGNLFRHNLIAQNDAALRMFQNSINNTFTENNFIDNLNPLLIVGKRTEAQWSDNGRGNYWSTYDGYDLDGNGIGDVPMKIQNVFHYLEGINENIRLYLYSPASQALAAATNAFPIIAINQEVDTHPLIAPVHLAFVGELTEQTENSQRGGLHPQGGIHLLLALVFMLNLFFIHRFKKVRS